MPVVVTKKEIGEDGKLCHDYEFVISDEDKLAEYVVEIIQAHHDHIRNLISGITPIGSPENIYTAAIESRISALEKRWEADHWKYKVDGLMFQMISWIVLAKIHKDHIFLMDSPHLQFAEHGFDGLAVKLDDQDHIERIVITEDKCTGDARKTISEKVFPEFEGLEKHERDFDISSKISGLLKARNISFSSELEIELMNPELRQYRIAITRQACHNADNERSYLYEDYDSIVEGNVCRRHASSIHLHEGERIFMDRFVRLVIAKLKSLISDV